MWLDSRNVLGRGLWNFIDQLVSSQKIFVFEDTFCIRLPCENRVRADVSAVHQDFCVQP